MHTTAYPVVLVPRHHGIATWHRCQLLALIQKFDNEADCPLGILAADVTYRLVRAGAGTSASANVGFGPGSGSGVALERKVVRLINSDDALFEIGCLL